ncbi:MAG: carbohydrate ABC transporter permease [Actinophytocola sp.]|uniref:carbohydrate ABC transporter permease n=1 Tax=Actinophytocola sp. TaxID=1872138 RepID=UPI003C757033
MSTAVASGRTTRGDGTVVTGRASLTAYLVAFTLVGLCLAPAVYIILGGFRTNSQIIQSPAGLPDPWEVGNYTGLLAGEVFWQQLINSVIAAMGTTVGVVVLGLMTSFVIARYPFKAKHLMYSLFAAGLMFPVTVAITPLYIMVRDLGLTDTLAGVILPQIAFAMPTSVIILVPFLRAIPKELEEAALIDGASRLGFFVRMVVPLSLPGVITVGILAFVASWNSYLLPLFLLSDNGLYTLPLGVQAFASQYSVDTARVLAFVSLSMIPALVFFSVFERRIISGLTGAVKG